MGFFFSTRSSDKLKECHCDLQRLFDEVIKHYDCKILCGHRDRLTQDDLYHAGRSMLAFPDSKHNQNPSLAIDVAPYPIIWPDMIEKPSTYVKDMGRFYYFVGFVKATALQLGIKIRLGADWNGNGLFTDQKFDDIVHVEILEDYS